MAAQAPLPQASVRPAPRSNTRRRSTSGASSWAKPILARSGNSGWRSSSAPSPATSTRPTSSTKNTACGLPMLTATGRGRPGDVERHRQRVAGLGQRDLAPVQLGLAHLDARSGRRRSRSARSRRSPTGQRQRRGAPSSNSSRATQRVPLPQAPDSLPSALKNRKRGVGVRAPARSAPAGRSPRRDAGRRSGAPAPASARWARAGRPARRSRCRSHAS